MKQLIATALLAGALLLAGCKQNANRQTEATQEATLLTYNVHNAIGMDGQRDYRRIADVIARSGADVVALQELDSVTERNDGVFALDTLVRLTGMHGRFARAIPFQGGAYGIGLLSKDEPLSVRTLPMPGREEARTLLMAEFKDYVFCVTHQSLTPEDQEAAVPLILQAMNSLRKPVFLAGDMNSLPEEKPQQLLRQHFTTLNDTAALTFPAHQPDRCLDYVYALTGNGHRFEVQKTQVLPEAVASDHRPVLVTVRFSPLP